MQITVDIPNDLQRHPEKTREIFASFVIEGFRTGALSRYQTRTLLGFETGHELDGFVKEHQVFERSYGIEDLMQDIEGLGL